MRNCELCGGIIEQDENIIVSVEAKTEEIRCFHNGCYNEYTYNYFHNRFHNNEMICKDCAKEQEKTK